MQEALGKQVRAAELNPRAAAYHRVLEDAASVILEFDESGTVSHVSPTVQAVLGYSADEVVEQLSPEWIHEQDRSRLLEEFSKLSTSGATGTASCRVRRKDGSWREFSVIASPYRNASGILNVVVHARDITSERETSRVLSATLERYQLVNEMSRDVVLMIQDDQDRAIWANSGLMNLMGYSVSDFRCRDDYSEKIHPDDRERVDSAYRKLRDVDETSSYEPYRFRHQDGSYRWFEGANRIYQTLEGGRQTLSVVRDVTKTQQALWELRESEERYRLIDELNDNIILLQGNKEGDLLWANSALYDVLGYTTEDLPTTADFIDKIHPDDREGMDAIWSRGYDEIGQILRYPRHRMLHKNGSWRWLATVDALVEGQSGEPVAISALRDVTDDVRAEEDRARLAEQINETQRLESLGVMAGGIAHDFNNLLTPIVGETSLALLDLPKDSPLQRPLSRIQKAAHRAAALTEQMLAYSGQGHRQIEPVDLSKLVEEMGQLLQSTVSGRAALSYSFEEDTPLVEGDSSQLSQVVMNLISNATDAVEEGSGSISVRTGVLPASEVDREHIVGGDELGSGDYVFVEVIDDGCGMEAQTIPRIFDPFFTTKFTGRGLGLASVVGIVRGHKGVIVLHSEVGHGTHFQVLLPAARDLAAKAPAQEARAAPWAGEGTVLVVDDDEGVRELAAATLERAGLNILLASDGREALDLFRLHFEDIRVVILDRTMPSVGGDAVFDEIRRIRPGTPVVLISGYSEEVALANIGKNLDAFLHKPFLPSDLLDTVRRVVEAKPR